MTDQELQKAMRELQTLYASRGLRPPAAKPPPRPATPEEVAEHERHYQPVGHRKDPRLKRSILIPLAIYSRHQAFFRDTYKPLMAPMDGVNAMVSVGEPEDLETYEKHCGWSVEDIATGRRVTHEGTCKGCS